MGSLKLVKGALVRISQRFIKKNIFIFLIFSIVSGGTFFLAKKTSIGRKFFNRYAEKSQVSEPLPYSSIGNYPPFQERQKIPSDSSYTLELTTCDSKTCIQELLNSFSKQGVQAFYTPYRTDKKVIFHIRKGIFPSRLAAEQAQFSLEKTLKIKSKVVEL